MIYDVMWGTEVAGNRQLERLSVSPITVTGVENP
jgi:hypothetical protein